jgi:hypothetical protein
MTGCKLDSDVQWQGMLNKKGAKQVQCKIRATCIEQMIQPAALVTCIKGAANLELGWDTNQHNRGGGAIHGFLHSLHANAMTVP